MGHQFPSEFYTKTNWKNEPDTSTPLGQANLNHIEQGIKTADERIYNLDGRIGVYEDYETEISAQVQQSKDYSEDAEDSASEASGYVDSCNTLANLCSQHYLNAKAEAQNSEAWAVGTRNGTPVPRTDETYENNSKYYAEQAQQIVDDFTINNETPTFTQASTRANINSGESISTILGKIKKFFADLKTVAFTGSYNDLLNKPEHLGHSIKDATTTFTDRASLKFTGNVSVSDDSTNDETIIDVEGKPDHFYATKEDMLDDIANIGEGEMAYTEEDASDLLTRVENIEQDVSDAKEDIVQLNSDLSLNTTTQTFSNAQFDITATTKYIDAHVAECNINFEFKQALPSGSFDITLTGLTKLPVFGQQRTVMIGNSMLYCTLNPSGVFAITNNSGTTMGIGYSQNVTFNYMTN